MVFSNFKLKGINIKNRIVVPPMVCFNWDEDGKVTEKNINHYESIAKGGAGLIITEAVCVSPTGKLAPNQLEIWSDDFIEGYSKLNDAIYKENVPVIAQIHHAGAKSITEIPVAPSEIENVKAKELSIEGIKEIEKQFIEGAIRIKKAGLNGVEIHGAHGYLLSYFLHPETNRRNDEYGGSIENRARIVTNIIKEIRNSCGDDFIIGVRYGGLNPKVDEGIKLGKLFEEAGCDILHISYGIDMSGEAVIPEDLKEFNASVYSAVKIKEKVNIPVIAANEISTYERTKKLIDNNLVDFVSIGRGILADYDFVNKIEKGEEPNKCFKCKPCKWPNCTSRNHYKSV